MKDIEEVQELLNDPDDHEAPFIFTRVNKANKAAIYPTTPPAGYPQGQ